MPLGVLRSAGKRRRPTDPSSTLSSEVPIIESSSSWSESPVVMPWSSATYRAQSPSSARKRSSRSLLPVRPQGHCCRHIPETSRPVSLAGFIGRDRKSARGSGPPPARYGGDTPGRDKDTPSKDIRSCREIHGLPSLGPVVARSFAAPATAPRGCGSGQDPARSRRRLRRSRVPRQTGSGPLALPQSRDKSDTRSGAPSVA